MAKSDYIIDQESKAGLFLIGWLSEHTRGCSASLTDCEMCRAYKRASDHYSLSEPFKLIKQGAQST